MDDPLIETWAIHDRIHAYLLNAIPDAALADVIAPKGKTVFKQFAHVHNVRLMWVKAAAPDLLAGLEKIEDEAGEKARLIDALAASGKAIADLLRRSIAAGGQVKNFKPHVTAFVGYLISHESHHRGQIGWTLKYGGHPPDKKTAFGIWAWGTR